MTDEIKILEERLKTAPIYEVDILTARIRVMKKEPEPKKEKPKHKR
jgi:hypothetical protein